jgi:hypothetical protein
MNRTMKFTLIAIAVFFLAVVGTFLWFVATWDPAREQPVVQRMPLSSDPSRGQT